ncbi:hypothetical protein Tco_1456509 [Tanacetum coccineum]
MEAFMEIFKVESMHVSGASECMRISGFMHGITNPNLIKKLNDNIPKFIDEMMSIKIDFLRGEVAAANQSKKKAPPAWKHYETGHRPNFDKRLDFKSQHKSSRRQYRFTPLTKTPKEILAMDTVKFKAPPPMTGLAENQNKNKFCEFHVDKGHSIDECIPLWRQIEKAVKSGQLSHLVKEIKQGGKRGEKAAKKGESSQQRKSYNNFHGPAMATNNKASSNKKKMILATTPLLGFNGEIFWPLGQISLMVTLEDEEHSTSALMNFMVVRSPSPYNGIIVRLGLRKIQAVPSIAHGMLKFPVEGGITMILSTTIIPAECRMIVEAHDASPPREPAAAEGIKVAIHPEYPEQTVTIGESLSEKGRMELCNFLKENLDIFAWKPTDIIGVP